MGTVLYLAHRIPYPPDKGDKIRSWHMLRALAERHRVLLGAFVDDPDDWGHRPRLEALCESVCLRPLPRLLASARGAAALARGLPVTVPWYRDGGMRRWVADMARRHRPDAAVAFSSAMMQYADALPDGVPVVADYVDVDSEKWAAYGRRRRGPLGWVYRREARTLLGWERRMAARAAAVVLVSEPEADLFAARAPEAAARVHAVGNGVDLERFRPDPELPDPYPPGTRAIAFTGLMDYWANVDAVGWFAEEVLPRVRAERPEAAFWIVGARPTDAVRRLESVPGVVVTGAVPDTRPYIAHAALCVAPMRVARGVQNKVLEALAMARPVVLTPEAAEGIALPPGTDGWVARDAEGFAARVLALLREPPGPRWAVACRRWMERHYVWTRHQRAFVDLVEEAAGLARGLAPAAVAEAV